MPANICTLVAEKRDEILTVADRYGITNVRVFGSVARREAREDSDSTCSSLLGPRPHS